MKFNGNPEMASNGNYNMTLKGKLKGRSEYTQFKENIKELRQEYLKEIENKRHTSNWQNEGNTSYDILVETFLKSRRGGTLGGNRLGPSFSIR